MRRRTYRQRGGYNTLKQAIEKGDLTQVETILKDPMQNTKIDSSAMVTFLVNHLSDISPAAFQQLISVKGINLRTENNKLFFAVVQQIGGVDLLDILLANPQINPATDNNKAFFRTDDVEIFKRLIADPRMNPGVSDNEIVKALSEKIDPHTPNFSIDVLLPLIDDPRVDPSVENNLVLKNILASYVTKGESTAKFYNPFFMKLLIDPRVRTKEDFASDLKNILYYSDLYNNAELLSFIFAA
jgi:hypothetical protein